MKIKFEKIIRFSKSTNIAKFIIVLIFCGLISAHASTLIADELRAYPESIVFNIKQGHSTSETRSIFIFTTSGTSMSWNQSKNSSWITTSLSSGVTEGILNIGVNATGMQPGIYYGDVIIQSAQSSVGPIDIKVSVIINPDVPVNITTWENGYDAAMSVSGDSRPSGFTELQTNGFKGTYFFRGTIPESYYSDYYNAGMEIGGHTVNHSCDAVLDDILRHQEIEPNNLGICTYTQEPCKDVISFDWPCGYTNHREQSVAAEYYMSARGYNINQLEDATPDNFMNLKCYNSHEHTPYPPEDLRTVIDLALAQNKWFNLVIHLDNETVGVDLAYAHTKNIWVAPIGVVIKYILQRDRCILTDYIETSAGIIYNVSRLAIPSSVSVNFEQAFGTNDLTTMEIDIDDTKTVENVYIDGAINPYQTKSINGNKVILTNVRLEPSATKRIEVRYVNSRINLTITGVTANNKVYDGTVSATLNTVGATLTGVLAGDNVTLITGGAAGTFSSKNAGTGKTVTTSGFTLGGTDAGKYTLSQPSATASITQANLTISGANANNKVYDRTTSATLNTGSAVLVGKFGGDVVTLVSTGASGTFANKNVGTSKVVTVTGFTLSGTDSGNYTLTQPSLTANITSATVTVSGVTANNKVYDGTISATLNTGNAGLSGVIVGDAVGVVTTGATGSFDNEFSGTSKTVTTKGFTLSGTDSGNYILIQPTTTADIIGLSLTITGVTANNKVYNGTSSAILNTGGATLVGVQAGDNVSLVTTSATGSFSDKNAGISKTVSTTGFTLGGTDARKYSLTQPVTTANITMAGLTVSGLTASNKVYDRTITATLNTGSAVLTGKFGTDNVILVSSGATGLFVNRSVGTSKIVSTTGFTLSGTDAVNYTLTQPTTTANITAAPVAVSGVIASNKVYDGTTSAGINAGSAAISGVIGGDAVTLVSTGVSGSFSSKNVGAGKTVTATGFSLSGADAGNYSITQPVLTANITALGITVTGVTANNKVYNGTTATTLSGGNARLSGVLGGDVVSLVFTGSKGTFENKDAGTSKIVTASGITLGGTDSGNYTLTQPTTTADITVATLRITGVTVNDKVYDGTTAATLNISGATLSGVFGSDDVDLVSINAAGVFTNMNAGSDIPVSISGFSVGGADTGNYLLTQPALIADINTRPLTLTATDVNKPYRTTYTFTGKEFTSNGLVTGDNLPVVTLSSPGTSESAVPGEYVIMITSGAIDNYNIKYGNGTLKVDKFLITAKADNKTKVYGSPNPSLTITYTGFLNGDDASVLDVPPVVLTEATNASNAGEYPITLAGGLDNGYTIKLVNGNLEVLKAPLTVTAEDKTKYYGEPNPPLTITYSGFVSGQDQNVIDVLPVAETDASENADVGDYEIKVSGAADNDYSFTLRKGTFTVKKANQVITFDELPSPLRITQEIELKASVSSGLPASFNLSDTKKGNLNGNVLTLNEDGKLTITAVQQGDHNWNPAKEVSQSIDVLPTYDNISSLFTPNADGMNDYWYIPDLEEYGRISVTVYNRFGQIVYKSDNYNNDWDGTWNGNPLPSASYYYIIKSSDKGFLKGVVNIVR
jgi:gliding motility-associated-like protein